MRNPGRLRVLMIALLGATLLGIGPGANDSAAGSGSYSGVHSEVLRGGLFQSHAMNAMLRADRDKDGLLSRGELEQYDLALARRFKEADADRDSKLSFSEFEKLFSTPDSSASR